MNFTIDREKFKQLLSQFKGDIIYETELIQTLFNQMPENYVNDLIETLYYERIYKGTYYLVQHSVYSTDKHIFFNYAEIIEFLNSVKLDDKGINKFTISAAIEKGNVVAGYKVFKIINKEENNNNA